MWWNDTFNERVVHLDKLFYNHIKNTCSKVLFTYPPVPLELSDLYNVVLYKVASDIIYFNGQVNIDIYILSKAKGFAKNECRRYLTNKHKVLNNFIPLKEEILRIEDVDKNSRKINVKKLTYIERLVLKMIYFENSTKVKVMTKTTLSRRELEKVIGNIKLKIKSQL